MSPVRPPSRAKRDSRRISVPPVVLASASPRRAAILQALGLSPAVRPSWIDETPRAGEAPGALVVRLACEKALQALAGDPRSSDAARRGRDDPGATPVAHDPSPSESATPGGQRRPRGPSAKDPMGARLVVGADTVVVLDGEIFGKPSDPDHARSMLARLSGRTHEVLTGLAAVRTFPRRLESGLSTTRVAFARLSADEIARYVSGGEPLDKAGAYAIQGAGGRFVQWLDGSYTNVVGFPVELFRDLLARLDLSLEELASS